MVEKSPFHIAAKRLEIDVDVNKARLIRRFLALNLCLELLSPKSKMSAVVERPDHYFGDDLVSHRSRFQKHSALFLIDVFINSNCIK